LFVDLLDKFDINSDQHEAFSAAIKRIPMMGIGGGAEKQV
jgi:hypothetical protein